VYQAGAGPISEDALPPLGGGFRLEADVEVAAGADGIVCALGDWSNGWALYLLDGKLVATFNLFGTPHRVAAPDPVSSGRHALGVEYRRQPPAGGPVAVLVDREVVHEERLPADLPFRWQIGGAGLLIGRDRGFPVCDDYRPPFAFTGELRELVFEIPALAPGGVPVDADAEITAALQHE
jgi:arylsulfatase